MIEAFIRGYQSVTIYYFTAVNTFYFLLLLSAFITIFTRLRKFENKRIDLLLQSESVPTVGIIVPSYNEEGNVIFCIQALLNLSYRRKEIFIINDGSTDRSLEVLKTTFKLTSVHKSYVEKIHTEPVRGYYHSLIYPNLIVIDKENGGRADAINVGINACRSDYFLTIDADTVIDNEQMTYLMRHILINPGFAGYGAAVRVANGCTVGLRGIERIGFPKTYWGGIQAVEYLRAFYMGRMGFEPIGGGMIISGAFAIYQTKFAREEVGGFDAAALGEDMEMCTHMKKIRYQRHMNPYISYVPQPVCWTEVPEDYRTFCKQRIRWQIAMMEVIWNHRTMFFNPRYGWSGMVSFPYVVLVEFLAPLLEACTYVVILLGIFSGFFDWEYYLLFFLITCGFTYIMNISCCLIEVIGFRKYFSKKNIRRMFLYSFMENLGFRQIYLWWRIKAFFKILQPRQTLWPGSNKGGFTAMHIEGERGKTE